MKLGYKLLFGACVAANLIATSCVDDMKFGNSFLDKAPGGTATVDTVFSSAVYTQQFLNSIYGRQYYGLPYKDDTSLPVSSSPYCGKVEALTDCWQLHRVTRSFIRSITAVSIRPITAAVRISSVITMKRCGK